MENKEELNSEFGHRLKPINRNFEEELISKADSSSVTAEGKNSNVHLDVYKSILPEKIRLVFSPQDNIPTIKETPLQQMYLILGEMFGAMDYEFNLATFWLLDVVIQALQKAQDVYQMSQKSQKTLVAWFDYLLDLIKDDGKSKEDVFTTMRKTILSAGYHLNNPGCDLPCPYEIGLPTKKVRGINKIKTSTTTSPVQLHQQEKNIHDMVAITDIIYSVFANPFSFNVIRSAFCKTQDVIKVEFPHTINFPKKLKPLPPPLPVDLDDSKKRKHKKESSILQRKTAKKQTKGSKLGIATPAEEVSKLNQEELPKEPEEEKNKFILPLKDAVTHGFFKGIFRQHFEEEKKETKTAKRANKPGKSLEKENKAKKEKIKSNTQSKTTREKHKK
ncbi:unnamed protein product [Timema podura]|uniref:Uncharacterized protein n=1 Tax=Timema podura TaxID=61482 RepID=A0ABN7NFE2_TIMPD|nr:unnamed protein product [Timema podura]